MKGAAHPVKKNKGASIPRASENEEENEEHREASKEGKDYT